MQAAKQAVKAARAEYLPTASISGAYGVQGNSFETGRVAYNGVGSINIPVFQSERVRGDTTQADATLDSAAPSMPTRRARQQQTRANAPSQVAIRNADVHNQAAGVQAAKASLEMSHLNLGYAHIISPVTGIIMQRSAEIGDRVSVGQQLMQVVQVNNLWIDANFRETQLKKIRVRSASDGKD